MKKALFVLFCSSLSALPQNPSIHTGEASFRQAGQTLYIEASDQAAIDWETFQIGGTETVQFLQPSADSLAINRVLSSSPTEILGSLRANGQICLINPNGILVGKDAVLDVGSLTASASDLLARGKLIHQGTIFSKGNVSFQAKDIDLSGKIESPNGSIQLNALEGFHFSGDLLGRRVEVTTEQGQGMIEGSIRSPEGTIEIFAPYIMLGGAAWIDASGPSGGKIAIGKAGGIQAFIEPGARLFADGFEETGGEVIAWSDQATSFRGFISAKGVRKGGFIEISSPGYLEYRGQIDLAGAEYGTLLLDPTNITIDAGMTTGGVVFGNPTTLPATTPVNILASDLTTALNAGNVKISTTSGQAAAGTIQITTGFGWTGNTFLELDADSDITLNALINPTGTFAGNQVFLNAAGNLIIRSSATGGTSVGVTTVNGGIRLAGNNINIGNTAAVANDQTLIQANGANGNITINSAANLTLQGGNGGNLANVFVEAAQNMNVTAPGTILLDGGSANGPGLGPKVTLNVLNGTGAQTIGAGNLTVRSGSGTFCRCQVVSTGASQTITLAGDLTIQGGSGTTGDAAVSANKAGTVQIIQANNISVLGGNTGSGNPATIICTAGSSTITAAGQVLMQGGAVSGSQVTINGVSTGSNLHLTANRLDILGGNGTNSLASVVGFDTEIFDVATSIRLIGAQNGVMNSQASILTNLSSIQINCQSLHLESGPGLNSNAEVSAIGTLDVTATGAIEIFSTLNNSNQSEVRSILAQTIRAGSINQQGRAYLGFYNLLVPAGNQTLIVAGDHTVQALAGGFNASVTPLSTASQFATIGGNLLIQAASGSTATWSKGDGNSTLNVAGNSSLFGNGGTASMSGTTNNTFITAGNLTTNAGTGGAVTVTLGASSAIRTGGNATLGTAAKTGRDTFSLGNNSTFAVKGNLTAVAGSSGICQTTVTFGAAGTGSSNGTFITGASAGFVGGSAANATCGVTMFGSGAASVGRDLFITGGSANGANAFVQSSPNTGAATALFSVNVGRDIVVQGGSGGTAQGFILTTRGSQQVSAGRNLSIVGGTGTASNIAVIGGGFTVSGAVSDATASTVQALGNIVLINRTANAYVDTTLAGRNTSNPGSVTVQAAGDVKLSTSIATLEVAQTTLPSHPLFVEADHPFGAGALWAANSDPFLSGTPLANASPATGRDAKGGFSVATGPVGGGISFTSQKGAIFLSSADHFANNSLCDLTIGPTAVLNNLTLTSTSGDISVDPFHNIYVTNGVTTLGNVFMIAQNNIEFTASGFITAGQRATLVVDNQAPTSPLIGPGAFIMASGSTIASGSTLRIYTARQSQNSILGLLNTLLFTPGALFSDTAQEVWCTYYPTLIPGLPFTVSYKDCLVQAASQANLIVSEFLIDLHDMKEFPGWEERFLIWNKVPEYGGSVEKYLLARRLLKVLNQPKSYTHFDFAP